MYMSEQIEIMFEEIKKYDVPVKRQVIAKLCDKLDENIPPLFYAKLLEVEKDDICRWYEIRALGDLKAEEYIELLIKQLSSSNVCFEQSSIHAITAYSIGKIGEKVIPALSKLDLSSEELNIAVMDCYGEIKSEKAIPYIKEFLLKPYNKATTYAALALGKIGREGINEIIYIYQKCDYKTRFVLFESLLGYCNERDINFVQEIINENPEFWDKVCKMDTRNFKRFCEMKYIDV